MRESERDTREREVVGNRDVSFVCQTKQSLFYGLLQPFATRQAVKWLWMTENGKLKFRKFFELLPIFFYAVSESSQIMIHNFNIFSEALSNILL